MAIIGIRASSQEIRYAILDKNENGEIVFVNQNTENRLKYPANVDAVEDKLHWVKSEVDRILRQNEGIEKIILKMNEYAGTENSSKRETTYVDAVLLLCAIENGIQIERRLNSQISSTAAKAKELAERRVGRTENYWNNTIADAILAAFWEMRK
ncbi:hypothetical protein [Oscillibacter sp. GMB15532]|uniref:hypothetical protein n=1 Tax=Oscillibacter sp. GMB15532 TaxID=3230022 RepID=UPI0034DF44BA